MITLIMLSCLGQFRRSCNVQQYYQPVYQPQQYYQQAQYQFVVTQDYDLVGEQQRYDNYLNREAKIDKILNYIENQNKLVDPQNKLVESQNKLVEPRRDDSDDPPNINQNYSEAAPLPPTISNNTIVPSININDAPSNVAAIFKTNCVKCHTNGSKYNLFTAEGKPNNLQPKQLLKIDFQVHTGRMPKNNKPLSNENYTLIREWIGSYEEQILTSMR